MAAAELRGKGDAETEALRNAAMTAEQRVAEAQAAGERVASELRDYKVCACLDSAAVVACRRAGAAGLEKKSKQDQCAGICRCASMTDSSRSWDREQRSPSLPYSALWVGLSSITRSTRRGETLNGEGNLPSCVRRHGRTCC